MTQHALPYREEPLPHVTCEAITFIEHDSEFRIVLHDVDTGASTLLMMSVPGLIDLANMACRALSAPWLTIVPAAAQPL